MALLVPADRAELAIITGYEDYSGFNPMDPRTKYIGMTGRSLHCRSLEHIDKYNRQDPTSVLLKHVRMCHSTEMGASVNRLFRMEQLSSHRSNLHRAVTEALYIDSSKDGTLINEKGGFGRTKLVRFEPVVTQH